MSCAAVAAMSAQGSLFLSRHRLRDVYLGVDVDGENRDGTAGAGSGGSGGDLAAQRCTDTKNLTENVDRARSDLTGPTATDNIATTTQPTIDQNQDQYAAMLLSMVSNRLDHMQAALLERLDRINSANRTNNAASQITTVNAQYAAIMERLDCMDAKINAQQELLLQLQEAVTGRYRDG